jgi:hypothetical protein
MTMQYCDYIASDNARREREQQLLSQYNQAPVSERAQNLWMHQVERPSVHKITAPDIIWAIVGLLGAGVILILSICL